MSLYNIICIDLIKEKSVAKKEEGKINYGYFTS